MASREELARSVNEAEWEWLRAHLERAGLIVVAEDLDLVETGLKIAADDSAAVRGWIDAGLLTKPSQEQVASWDRERGRKFQVLIVSPYVLIQERIS